MHVDVKDALAGGFSVVHDEAVAFAVEAELVGDGRGADDRFLSSVSRL